MPITELSLAVVGAAYPNKRGGNRQFEIALCFPGEPVELVPEPKNKADERAVAVYSARQIQLGYLTAERCGWIGAMLAEGRPLEAVFQRPTRFGAVIRVNLDGHPPELPDEWQSGDSAEPGFYPDFIPPDY